MQTFTASEAKNKLGLVLDSAQQHPISIEKQGRPFVVILSQQAYETLENAFWILQAKEAQEQGFLSKEESQKLLRDL